MTQYTLYYKPTCPYCQKVLRFLDKHEIDIPLRDIKADPDAYDDLVKLGGKDMVPMLMIDDTPMYESSDIIAHLKEKYVKKKSE